jgi:hypothetical protein
MLMTATIYLAAVAVTIEYVYRRERGKRTGNRVSRRLRTMVAVTLGLIIATGNYVMLTVIFTYD